MNDLVKPEEKLIIALDRMSDDDIFSLIEKIPDIVWVKVGLELFTNSGPEVILKLRELGKKVFLDLKFHDIPSTMGRACYRAAKTGAQFITVHACAGTKALKESNQLAIEGAKAVGLPPPTLLAVTVLTSWESKNFEDELNIRQSLDERVNLLGKLAFSSGIGGCICSPLEVNSLRRNFPQPFQLITPGVRSIGVSLDDQQRVLTPLEALKAGASKLVIGREITKSNNPVNAFRHICSKLIGN